MTDKALKTNACWDNLGEHTVDDDRFVLSCSFESELSAAQQENQRLREELNAPRITLGNRCKAGHDGYWITLYGNCMACRAERLAAIPTTAAERQEIIEECAKVVEREASLWKSEREVEPDDVSGAKGACANAVAAIRALNPKEEHHKGEKE